ncbi:helix-turn-helix domain-containing protein [Cellulomonas marina]|uniref:Cupin domain-containing protein n=1 Tax=Cellulomonas marina TaxID=988821 RepID=A0A1I0V860_9CELL|nr:XRE family transcriptional regulator [Cellulomonas marina]GIG29223.1 XRE family transcriptional regulator [Cellulomonas marina]SFA72574.1 Cupin domain-containing protein [Cellulomonas marina]
MPPPAPSAAPSADAPPAASERVVDPQAARIGAHIRALRRRRSLTLVQLAAAAGLSHPFLSQLERGHTRASMVSLDRVAAALGTSQAELLAAAVPAARAPGDTRPEVLRADEGARGPFPQGEARLLTRSPAPFEPMEFVGANTDPGEYYVHVEDEFLYVVSGTVLLDLGEHGRHLLAAGDCARYRGGTPHRWSTAGTTTDTPTDSTTDSAAEPGAYRVLVVKQVLARQEAP